MKKMSKRKSSGNSKVSMGGRSEARKRQEFKRQAKFASRKGTDREYKYTPNPYKKGTAEYDHEALIRKEKNKNQRLPYAKLQSIFAKLDNYLNKQALAAKAAIITK